LASAHSIPEVAAVENESVGAVEAANAGCVDPNETTAAVPKKRLRHCCNDRVHGSNARSRTSIAMFIVFVVNAADDTRANNGSLLPGAIV
jgi:hypothetical protein